MKYEDAIKVTKGNNEAAVFLIDYVAFCHLLDDVVDKDVPVNDERLVKESLNLMGHFCINSWVKANSQVLFPLIVSGFNAWPDSNRMARSNVDAIKTASDVVKGIYHEIIYVTAYMCGGHEHMRMIGQQREYDMEAK